MKVLVCGSRDWTDYNIIANRLADLAREHESVTVIHGAARGADRIASCAGRTLRLDVQAFPADWDRYGKRAGILRNLAMLDEGPGLVLAFHRNGSRGTQHTIDEAQRLGIPVEVHRA